MYDGGNGSHFYIDEPAQMKDGQFVLPLRWLEDEEGRVWADAWEIVLNSNGTSSICDNDNAVIRISAHELDKCMLQLESEGILPVWCAATLASGHAARMPNPDRIRAGEQFEGIKRRIESTHEEPVRFRDPITGDQARFKIFCLSEPGDNPAQSQASGHIGGKGNHPCRKCEIGGSQKDKETDEGFHALFSAGPPRSAEQTLIRINDQIETACLGVAAKVKEKQTEHGIKDAFSQSSIDHLIVRARLLKKENPQRSLQEIQAELMEWVSAHQTEIINPFLTLKGFDAAKDTPVEILHTILLGIVKYGWYGTRKEWNAVQEKTYIIRLQSTNATGLSIHPIRAKYIMQYANSLNGRQLKTLAQVNLFHIYDLADSLHFSLIQAIGELSALLWFPEIKNLEQYLNDVDIAVANVLDIAALIDPTKIVAKIKYHLLLHLRDDIRRFGPLVGVATEVFECFNAVFRFCSIYSNHLAPSRDIAHQLAKQESFKHLASGGWWMTQSGDWIRAGASIHEFMSRDKILPSLIGWDDATASTITSGAVKLLPESRGRDGRIQKRQPLPWTTTMAATADNATAFLGDNESIMWFQGKHVIAKSHDTCSRGSWVFARQSLAGIPSPDGTTAEGQIITGQILEIIQDVTSKKALVTIDEFHVLDSRHITFGMPVLSRRSATKKLIIIEATGILFEYNTQHDCLHSKCTASGHKAIIQERIETELTDTYIQHQHRNDEKYIINTHAFHNAHLVREILPRELTRPLPYSSNRQSFHDTIAQSLRKTQDAKRSATSRKKRKIQDGQDSDDDPHSACS
ncbi:hypothetical protein CVT24_001412 [Panaeolus cyanescens]|uniref:Uncharacterized protein n=1 Tax=Panaeolus cyanescens TaxID=181874 RepID=A0A409YYY7_9AGAR|nr:hypothetical protein CVT24_001412 [Panaeolus cyanescens]